MPQIEEILTKLSIPHVGADHSHGTNGWVNIDCPWCVSTGKYHLGISLTTGAASCWRCGLHSTAEALTKASNRPIGTVRGLLGGLTAAKPLERVVGTLREPRGVGPLLAAHRHYLEERGFDPDQLAAQWGIGGIGLAAKLAWRIYIPIHHHGQIVSWTTRSIGGSGPRYISAPVEDEAIPHKSLLYGSDRTNHAIIIVEGPTDVWAIGPGTVATCGTGWTTAQLRRMSEYPVRAVCFDASEQAQRRAAELTHLLAPYPGATHNVLLESGEDPADADPAEILELRNTLLCDMPTSGDVL